MNKFLSIISGVLLFIVVLVFCFGLNWLGVEIDGFFMAKKENIRRKVFVETQSYNQGKLQELAKYRWEYHQANLDGKLVLNSVIRHKFSDYNTDKLPVELKQFLENIRGY